MLNDEEGERALYEAHHEKGDPRLITPAQAGAPTIDFSHGGGWRECRIWEGYFDASYILLERVLQSNGREHDLIFPALFSLRHGMEVALKWHIRYAGGVVPKNAAHNLVPLADAFRKTAEGLDDVANYVSEYMLDRVIELASIDPRAVAFRYSTEVDGSEIEINPKQWDLRHLYFAVGDLIVVFDATSDWIERSWNEDYLAYMRS